MSYSLIHCPACNKMLRSDRPIPIGSTLRCPECGAGFDAPRVSSWYVIPILSAAMVSLLVVGGSIAALMIFSGPRDRRPEPVAGNQDDATRRLAEEQKKLEEIRRELTDSKKRLDLAGFIAEGKAALAAGKFDAGEKAFGEALKLDAQDLAALDGLIAARSGLAANRKDSEDLQNRTTETARLLSEGRKAVSEKQYAVAVRSLESALLLAPANVEVKATLAEARTALERDETQKKKLQDYNARFAAAKTAFEAGQYTDSVREYTAALAIMPDSLDAKDGQKRAEAKLVAGVERDKQQREFELCLNRARKAISDTRYTDALTELNTALKLIPDDREGNRLVRTTKETLDKVKASNAKLLAAANLAASNGQLDEAVRLAEKAVAAWAEDEKAKKMLKNAQQMAATARTNQESYLRNIQAGAIAMAAGQYDAAVLAYAEALRLNPTNDEVARQLRNARLALENYQRNRLEYERLVRIGNLALNRNSFAEALKAFQAALRLLPDDLAARDGARQARYGQAMNDGQQALSQKRKMEAVTAFEAALVERPGDMAAMRGLQLARLLR